MKTDNIHKAARELSAGRAVEYRGRAFEPEAEARTTWYYRCLLREAVRAPGGRPKGRPKKPTCIALPLQAHDRLAALAKRRGKTKSQVVADLIMAARLQP